MATTRAATTPDQHKSPVATQQTSQGQMSGQGQLEQGSESSPPLHRYLGNSYMQAMTAKTQRLGLQTKLTVNEPGDIYEQEADRVADQIMAAPTHANVGIAPLQIQRFSGQAHGQTDAAPASVGKALASPGRPLESALRQDMEQRFGYDFSRVRVHTDAAAEQSARDVNAHAYTLGHNIVFAAGRFAPGTTEGRRLIAHELTHVVQQSATGNGPVSGLIQRQPTLPTENTPPGEIPGTPQRDVKPPVAPIAWHLAFLEDIDDKLWLEFSERNKKLVTGEPGVLNHYAEQHRLRLRWQRRPRHHAKSVTDQGRKYPRVRRVSAYASL